MKKRSTIIALLLSVYTGTAHAMLCVIRRTHVPFNQQKRVAHSTVKFFEKRIKKIGLKKCIASHEANQACQNEWCCKYAFLLLKDKEIQQAAEKIRHRFLSAVDNGPGRIAVGLNIARAYDTLCVLENQLRSSGLKQEYYGDYVRLWTLIHHQKICLYNQFRVFAENSENHSQVRFRIDNENRLIVEEINNSVMVNTSENEKE